MLHVCGMSLHYRMPACKDKKTYMVSAVNYSLFRFFFGILMIPQVLHLTPHVHDLSKSAFVFHYPGLSFIEAYSHGLIDLLQAAAIVSAVLLALGIIPRMAALLFMCSFGYLFLIDISFYNNHYYLWCLLAFLFACTEAGLSISVFDVFRRRFNKQMHVWNYAAFGLLITIVYFYGGTAKLNGDWLQGYPMRLYTHAKGFPSPDLSGYFLSYTGLLFDLLIGLLLWRFARSVWVVALMLVFHISNYFLFDIGEFPLVMIAAWLIYIPLSRFPLRDILKETKALKKPVFAILGLFFAFQLLFPARALLLYGGNVAWHRQGYNFSWRMMLNNHKPSYFQFLVDMPERDDRYHVDFEKLLTYRQFYHTYHEPYMIWQLAQKLHSDAQKKYGNTPIHVYCKSLVALNQHPPRSLINERADLAAVPFHHFSPNHFVNTFTP